MGGGEDLESGRGSDPLTRSTTTGRFGSVSLGVTAGGVGSSRGVSDSGHSHARVGPDGAGTGETPTFASDPRVPGPGEVTGPPFDICTPTPTSTHEVFSTPSILDPRSRPGSRDRIGDRTRRKEEEGGERRRKR